MVRSRIVKLAFFVAGGVVAGLFPGCLVPLIPLAPLGLRIAGNAVIEGLLSLSR